MHKKMLILITVLALLLVACGNNDNEGNKNDDNEDNTSMMKDVDEESGDDTYVIALSKEMEDEAKLMGLSNEEILSVVQNMTQEEADRLGMSLEAYIKYLDDKGQTAFGALKEAMKSSGVNFKTMFEAQAMLEKQEADREAAANFKWEISEDMILEADKLKVEPSEVLEVTKAFAELQAADDDQSLEDYVANLASGGFSPFELLKMMSSSSAMDIFEFYEFALSESQAKDASDEKDATVEKYDTDFIMNLFYNLYYQAHDVIKEDKSREGGRQTHVVHYYSDETAEDLLEYFVEALEVDQPQKSESYNLNAIFGKHTAMVNIKPSDRSDYTSFVEVEVVEYEKEAEDINGGTKVEAFDFSVEDYMIKVIDFLHYEDDYIIEDSVNYQENMTMSVIEYFSYKAIEDLKDYYEAIFDLDAVALDDTYKILFEKDGNTIEITIGDAGVDDYKAYIYMEIIEPLLDSEDNSSDDRQAPGVMTGASLSLNALENIDVKDLGDVTVTGVMGSEVQDTEIIYYALGKKERIDMVMPFGKFITLYDPISDQSYEYSDTSSEGYYYEGNIVTDSMFGMNTFLFNMPEDFKAKWTDLEGQEVLYVQTEVDDMMFDVWFHKDYMIPVKYILSNEGSVYVTYEMAEIKSGGVDESLFDIPEGINFIEE